VTSRTPITYSGRGLLDSAFRTNGWDDSNHGERSTTRPGSRPSLHTQLENEYYRPMIDDRTLIEVTADRRQYAESRANSSDRERPRRSSILETGVCFDRRAFEGCDRTGVTGTP